MREIKFRGKRKDNGEWIVGNLFIPNKLVGGIWICPETTYGDFYPGLGDGDDLKDYEFGGISLGHFHEVIPETVGEYTGLKDKNGKEIYEGDIMPGDHDEANWVCEWSDVDACFVWSAYDYPIFIGEGSQEVQGNTIELIERMGVTECTELEIVGNIYEHDHLLK